ncbi:unnamed protein product [Musa acuminata subsp. burmannicoides]
MFRVCRSLVGSRQSNPLQQLRSRVWRRARTSWRWRGRRRPEARPGRQPQRPWRRRRQNARVRSRPRPPCQPRRQGPRWSRGRRSAGGGRRGGSGQRGRRRGWRWRSRRGGARACRRPTSRRRRLPSVPLPPFWALSKRPPGAGSDRVGFCSNDALFRAYRGRPYQVNSWTTSDVFVICPWQTMFSLTRVN